MAVLDYRLQETINPMDVAMRGFQGLQSIQANREAILARQAQAGAFMAQQQAEQVRAAQINQEMQQAQAMMAAQQALADKVAMRADTPEDYQALTIMMSKSAPDILAANKNASERQQQIGNVVTDKFAQAFALLRTGQADAANGILQNVATAVERDSELAPQANALRAIIQAKDPKLQQQILGQYLAFTAPDRLKSAIDASVSAATEAEQIAAPGIANRAARAQIAAGGAPQMDAVQSSTTLDDGTVIMVMKSGNTVVSDRQGRVLTGQPREDAILAGQEYGVGLTSRKAGGREGSTLAAREVKATSDALTNVQRGMLNIDAAIAALDRGATSGVIQSKFPTWNAAAIELNLIRNKLGLDVVGSYTFGALSEGELALALNTALPTNMAEADLRRWLVRQKAAQAKVVNLLNRKIAYLSVPNTTIGDWQRFLAESAVVPPPPPPPPPPPARQPMLQNPFAPRRPAPVAAEELP
jgi:hypothetical protein